MTITTNSIPQEIKDLFHDGRLYDLECKLRLAGWTEKAHGGGQGDTPEFSAFTSPCGAHRYTYDKYIKKATLA